MCRAHANEPDVVTRCKRLASISELAGTHQHLENFDAAMLLYQRCWTKGDAAC